MRETVDNILSKEIPFQMKKKARKEVKCDRGPGPHLNLIDRGPCSHEAKWMSRH